MSDWVKFQQKLFRQVQQEIRPLLHSQSVSLKKYASEYRKDLSRLKLSSRKEFVQSLNASDICFFGDFHSLPQSQRILLRLLRDKKVRPPKSIGFEIFSDSSIQRIGKARSTEQIRKILNELEIEKKWGSSSETYLELLSLCKANRIKLVGLYSSSPTLKIRDRSAAQTLSELKGKSWVLFGEFHCARQHLPFEVAALNANLELMIVQQNSDALEKKFLAKRIQSKDLIFCDLSKAQIPLFCILHTPLWVKWQSYLDAHIIQRDDTSPLDAQEQISWCLRTLLDFLEDSRYATPVPREEVLDLSVLSSHDEDFFESLSALNKKEKKWVLSQLEVSRVAILAHRRRIFLSEISVNSCAQAAGAYLYATWTNMSGVTPEFFQRALFESISFLLSKILNHSRKSKTWKEWRSVAHAHRSPEITAILKSSNFSRDWTHRKSMLRSISPYHDRAAQCLGRALADLVFEAFLVGEFSKARLLRILITERHDSLSAFETLVELKSVGRIFE
ncbi:MAG: hypothetical protein COV44_06535 [Deltaproteobacteria bacterium CG11_big_fil_rev_8_21_14_0_20_45_16]|nr:MAG: hypothetical protein COV44_06535 [Deltaproteobacteria bacterium CG11_big_fil_rev_8_21_14_0_20_45_16]